MLFALHLCDAVLEVIILSIGLYCFSSCVSYRVDRNKYQIQIPLPPKIDPSVTMMTVEEKPDVTYNDVGGCKEQIEKMREVVELPMLHPEKFVKLGIDPPKGVLCYGPPGTGKTLLARAVANRTDACFIRVIGSELVQKYVGEGARMVRELFQMARSKKACIVFFDEVDAIGGARFDDGVGGDNEVQRTMLEIVNQLDGFDARGNIKVLMATNRPDTLDPALLRPGRLDRKVEFGLPDLEGRTQIFKIHTRTMNCERDIRFELLARLCPNSTGKCREFLHDRIQSLASFCSMSFIFNLLFFFSRLAICVCWNRGRHTECVHGGWHVRHPRSQEDGDREGFLGRGE